MEPSVARMGQDGQDEESDEVLADAAHLEQQIRRRPLSTSHPVHDLCEGLCTRIVATLTWAGAPDDRVKEGRQTSPAL